MSIVAPRRGDDSGRLVRGRAADRANGAPKLGHTSIGVVLVVVVAPHLLAGAYAWTTAVIALLAITALSMALWSSHAEKRLGQDPVILLFGTAVCVNALHALPLPTAWIARLAPDALHAASETARGLSLPSPQYIAFTLAPAATWERLLFGASVLATLCASRVLFIQRMGALVLAAVAVSSVLVALSHLGHRAVAATSVYGVYLPRDGKAHGPVLNPNNLSGLLALGLPICIGLALQHRGPQRWVWVGAGTIVGATGLLAGSRGGALALLGGPLLFGLLYGARRLAEGLRKGPRYVRSSQYASAAETAIYAAFVLLAIFGLADLASDNFLDTSYEDLTKLELFRQELDLLLSNTRTALFGVGRGAFSVAFGATFGVPARALYAENLPLQYAIEFGIPFTTVLLLGLFWRLINSFRRWQSPAQLGGLVGLTVLSVQNLADFSLEMTGIAVVAAATLSACSSPHRQRLAVSDHRYASKWTMCSMSLFGATAISLLLSYPASKYDAPLVQSRLQSLAGEANKYEFWSALRDSAPYHPADLVLSGLAAHQKVLERAADAPFWLNRAMVLAPGWGLPHLEAAHWLAQRKRWAQAEQELATAAELDLRAFLSVLCQWLDSSPSAVFALRLAPPSRDVRFIVLDAAAACLAKTFPLESEKIDKVLLAEQPRHVSAGLRSARRALERREYERAKNGAHAIRIAVPSSSHALEIEASALTQIGHAHKAIEILQAELGRTDDRQRILLALSTAQAYALDDRGMRDTIELLRIGAAGHAGSLAGVMAHLSYCEQILGNDARAFAAIQSAYRLSDYAPYLATGAQLATKLGQIDFALKAWSDLCGKAPLSEYCHMRDALRQELRP